MRFSHHVGQWRGKESNLQDRIQNTHKLELVVITQWQESC